MSPELKYITANGINLAVYDWGDPSNGSPTILFSHATGFHSRCWDAVIEPLLAQYHVLAFDSRGHGRSDKPAPPEGYVWRNFGEDLAALGNALGLRGAIGVGHSGGGHAMALAASLNPNLFSKLILIDPVILPPDFYDFVFPEEHYAARRRNQWASADEMFERFKDRAPFNLWDQRVLRDYCDYGLLPNPDGDGFVLACPPAVEATIYQQSTMGNIYPDLPRVDIPVLVVRLGDRGAFATTDMLASPTNPNLAEHFPQGEDLQLKEYTHFAPMQAPERFAEIVRDFARG